MQELVNIHKAFSDILFNPKGHTYKSKKTNKRFVSTTQKIGKYKQSFDAPYWTHYKALQANGVKVYKGLTLAQMKVMFKKIKNPKTTPGVLAKKWKRVAFEGQTVGTYVHARAEQYLLGKADLENTGIDSLLQEGSLPLIKQAEQYIIDHPQYIPIKTELIVGDFDTMTAGQCDALLYDAITEDYVILDWKGLALDTPIPTVDGFKKMKDVAIGDNIFDGDGELTTVTNVSEVHNNPCYKIIFDTKEEIIADHEHRWIVNLKNKQLEMTTEELFQYTSDNSTRLKILIHDGIKLPEADLPLDPYVLGLWLADGNCNNSMLVCNIPEIFEEIKRRGYKLGENTEKREGKTECRTILNIRKMLASLDLLKNKHIPDIYFESSHAQRLDLLRGIMDGDGHYHKKRKRCAMETTKEWQEQAVTRLVASLGHKPSVFRSKRSTNFKKDITRRQVCFSPNENPFLIRNKDYNVSSLRNKYRYINIVEQTPTIPTKCITVDSPTKTYLVGYGFIKTHNTDKNLKLENPYQNMKAPLDHLEDSDFNKYSIQLSIYKYCLEKNAGIKISKCIVVNVTLTNPTYVEHELPYLKKEAIQVIGNSTNNKKNANAKSNNIYRPDFN